MCESYFNCTLVKKLMWKHWFRILVIIIWTLTPPEENSVVFHWLKVSHIQLHGIVLAIGFYVLFHMISL